MTSKMSRRQALHLALLSGFGGIVAACSPAATQPSAQEQAPPATQARTAPTAAPTAQAVPTAAPATAAPAAAPTAQAAPTAATVTAAPTATPQPAPLASQIAQSATQFLAALDE